MVQQISRLMYYKSSGQFHEDAIQDRLEGGRSIAKKAIYVGRPEHKKMLARNIIAALSVVAKDMCHEFDASVLYESVRMNL